MAEGTSPGVAAAAGPQASSTAGRNPLSIPYFRNLWLGATVSLIGDQFYLVALPWLVLQLTGSSLALGTIMMAAAVPRAVLMLMGGAISDRFAPKHILLTTNFTRMALVGIVAGLTWMGVIHLWHLYILAFLFGTADAFGFPAGQALLPTLVGPENLAPANAMFQSSMQASGLIGPAPAGFVIKRFGMAAAFLVDAISFLFAIVPLSQLPEAPPKPAHHQRPGLFSAVGAGLEYAWQDAPLRSLILLIAGVNMWAVGPIMIGMPLLAKFHFGSSAALGILMSSFGAGALVGMALGGVLKWRHHRGLLMLAIVMLQGLGIASIVLLHSLAATSAVLVSVGILGGYNNVAIMAWIQGRVDHAYMGRVMSVLMFGMVGLMPISFVIAGAVAQLHLMAMFVAAGLLMGATALVAGMNSATRKID